MFRKGCRWVKRPGLVKNEEGVWVFLNENRACGYTGGNIPALSGLKIGNLSWMDQKIFSSAPCRLEGE
jgi:hypothetical protein